MNLRSSRQLQQLLFGGNCRVFFFQVGLVLWGCFQVSFWWLIFVHLWWYGGCFMGKMLVSFLDIFVPGSHHTHHFSLRIQVCAENRGFWGEIILLLGDEIGELFWILWAWVSILGVGFGKFGLGENMRVTLCYFFLQRSSRNTNLRNSFFSTQIYPMILWEAGIQLELIFVHLFPYTKWWAKEQISPKNHHRGNQMASGNVLKRGS